MQGALGHAVKAHDQLFRLAMGLPVRLNAARQCIDIARCVVVMVDKPKLRQTANIRSPFVHRIKHTGRGGGAVLRIGGQNQHPRDAVELELVKLRCN